MPCTGLRRVRRPLMAARLTEPRRTCVLKTRHPAAVMLLVGGWRHAGPARRATRRVAVMRATWRGGDAGDVPGGDGQVLLDEAPHLDVYPEWWGPASTCG